MLDKKWIKIKRSRGLSNGHRSFRSYLKDLLRVL